MREREQSRFQIRERNGVDQDLAAVKIAEPVEPRALKDDVLCFLRKPVDEKHLKLCLLVALQRREGPGD